MARLRERVASVDGLRSFFTPWQDLLALDWEEIQALRAGDLLRVFEETGLTHLIVVEHDRHHSPATVRALVSRARLERQLRGLRQAS